MDEENGLLAILLSSGKLERDGAVGNIIDMCDHAAYTLPSKNLLSFWNTYTANLRNGRYPQFAEPIGDTFPLFLDFEIVFGGAAPKVAGFLGDEFRHEVVKIIQSAFDSTFQIDVRKQLIAVFTSSNYVNSDDGLSHHHFQVRFPYSRISKDDYRNYFLSGLLKELGESTVLTLCEEPPVHREWPKFIRKNELEILPMIGYVYDREDIPLKFTKLSVWPTQDEEQVMLEMSSFPDFFTFDECLLVRKREISRDDFELHSVDLIDWLPMFLSMYYSGGLLHIRPDVMTRPALAESVVPPETRGEGSNSIFPNDNKILSSLDTAKYFVSLMDKSRIREQRYWLDIGRAYRNIGKDALGRDAWVELSESVGISQEECDKYWDTLRLDNFIGIRTLAYYARSANRIAYNEWMEKWIARVVADVFGMSKPNHANVARLFYRLYWLEYITEESGNHKGYTWYHFNNTRWICEGTLAELKIMLSSRETRRHLDAYRAKYLTKKTTAQSEAERTSCDMVEQSIAGLIPKLGDDTFTNHVINYLGHYFLVPGVGGIFDQNINLLGMENSVLEVVGEKVFNRPGKPDDYIRMSTGQEYVAVPDRAPAMQELKNWLRQTFADDDLRDHFLKFSASLIRGGNPDKMFANMTGKGNNSKSQWAAMFEKMFGDYCYKAPMTTFTQKRGAGSSASPDIAMMKDKRLVIAEEPEEDDTMKAGLIKPATGNDTIYGRALYQGGIKFKATFKLMTFTNNPPAFTCTDRAMKERVHFFPFLSKWSYDAPEDESEQFKTLTFKRDPRFSDKVPGMITAFMHLLVTEYYGKYVREGLRDPQIALDATAKYWELNDVYTRFLCESIDIMRTAEGKLDDRFQMSLGELHKLFKPWLNEYYPGRKPPAIDFFSSEINDRLLAQGINERSGKFNGIRFRIPAPLDGLMGQ